MRKLIAALAMGGVLGLGMAGVANAQARRGPVYQPEYQYQDQEQFGRRSARGQYGQDQYNRSANRGQPPMADRYYAQRPSGQRASGQMQGANHTDQQLASWLLVDNRGEIQLARLAEEQASCDEVKEFAEQMVDDHAEMVEQLQRFAGGGQARGSRRSYDQRGQASNGGSQQSGELNFTRLKQQLGQQCVASAQRELQQKEGAEFDKCYIGMQLAMHMQMLDTLKVFSRYASPQLDQVIEQAEDTTQDHLEHAKHLIKQLESDDQGDQDDQGDSNRSSGRGSKSDEDNDRD